MKLILASLAVVLLSACTHYPAKNVKNENNWPQGRNPASVNEFPSLAVTTTDGVRVVLQRGSVKIDFGKIDFGACNQKYNPLDQCWFNLTGVRLFLDGGLTARTPELKDPRSDFYVTIGDAQLIISSPGSVRTDEHIKRVLKQLVETYKQQDPERPDRLSYTGTVLTIKDVVYLNY